MESAVVVSAHEPAKSDSRLDSVDLFCDGASANQTIAFVVLAAIPWPEALFAKGR
jgi:hypothetical protein